MSQVTQILTAIQSGDVNAAARLLPLVYEELRRLAAAKMAREQRHQTLQATALVHEAYLRLLGPDQKLDYENSRHFFAAAAEAMRRILVDESRRKGSLKRGGDRIAEPLDPDQVPASESTARVDDLIALDHALNKLAAEDATKAELVKLRYFAGLTLAQAGQVLGISKTTADRWWAYAKAFLMHELSNASE
jgi:RNA polymerase sigma factor (TIGR02999 family)